MINFLTSGVVSLEKQTCLLTPVSVSKGHTEFICEGVDHRRTDPLSKPQSVKNNNSLNESQCVTAVSDAICSHPRVPCMYFVAVCVRVSN